MPASYTLIYIASQDLAPSSYLWRLVWSFSLPGHRQAFWAIHPSLFCSVRFVLVSIELEKGHPRSASMKQQKNKLVPCTRRCAALRDDGNAQRPDARLPLRWSYFSAIGFVFYLYPRIQHLRILRIYSWRLS